jgi:hypothetical protein
MKDWNLMLDKPLLDEIKKLTNLICNMLPTTKIKGEIQSSAFWIAHHPMILNHAPQENKERANINQQPQGEICKACQPDDSHFSRNVFRFCPWCGRKLSPVR